MHKVKNAFITLALVVPALALAGPIDNVGLDVPLPQQSVLTSITEYTDEATWAAAIGAPTVINPYGDLAHLEIVTNQYLPVGALYTDGDDVAIDFVDSIDGRALNGEGVINVELSDEAYAVGINYPGAVRITGFLDGAPVFTSSDFGGSGTFFFAGIISTDPFDSLLIEDWVDGFVFIDDLNYDRGTVSAESQSLSAVKALFE
jgi:hypothetical protein